MSTATPQNVDTQFTVGKVNFDNKDGLGNTPLGGNVLYRGAVAWIKPSTFRAMATAADRRGDAAHLENLMRNGEAIAAPFVQLDLEFADGKPTSALVVGHEGRARADAFRAINGDIFMPVQLDFYGWRARDLSHEFFQWLNTHGVTAERSKTRVPLNAERFFWNETEVKPSSSLSPLHAKTRLLYQGLTA